MIIRCPQCEHTRSINESKIPPTAELATCPKCKHRFRFRTARPAVETAPETRPERPPRSFSPPPGPEVHRPQSAVRESAEQADIWDAVDALHERWQSQLDQHVTEVEQPGRPEAGDPGSPSRQEKDTTSAEKDEAPAGAVTIALRTVRDADGPLPDAPAAPPSRAPAQPEQGGPDPMPEKGMPVAFPYGNGGARPEDRVEHDMQMLRREPPSRPLRDLGRLKEFPDAEGDADDADTQAGDIPWENPAKYGWVRGFMQTIRGVMFDAPVLFSCIRPAGSLAPGYLFFLALGYLSSIATVAWGQAAAILLPGVFALPGAPMALPALLLLAPVALGLMLLFVTGCIKVVVSLFAPDKAIFPVIYRIVSYSVAPFLLSIVPFVGPVVGALWFLVALILGCRHGLGLSWGLACTAPLFPAAALLGGLVWYFL